ncbi:hypothetical protein Pan14r_36320 [Crateriforma conspicua]|uniref:Glycoamylase-like domain-containing protein n=2 Tax=Crateriforma conspicua TaxID=2527996 RepID=A0A5C5YDC8_9PLAN|nr:hypothetical protein Mal65_50980 [Crateriforma conspicua]TWT71322.1 hypothetical protein Pan14r_36320 [Crateriforma conspicua]
MVPEMFRRRFLLSGAAAGSTLIGVGTPAWIAAIESSVNDDLPVRRSDGRWPGQGSDMRDGGMTEQQTVFLDDLRQRCYQYFVDAADPDTGLIADRGRADGSGFSDHASMAACGFGLSAHALAGQNGWVSPGVARDRVAKLMVSLRDRVQHERGFLYHFVDRRTGRRALRSEASSIDTALLIAGAMHAQMIYANDRVISDAADEIYQRVDWRWLLGDNDCLHMGYTPEIGILPAQWDTFSELTILVLLAIGAPQSPIPARCWEAWQRGPVLHHQGQPFMSYPPLFVHQYPTAFFDFRRLVSSGGRSFWQNAQVAHRAHQQFMKDLANADPHRMGHYGEDLWGITSSDSAHGYRDWGGPYHDGPARPDRGIDGTIVPSAAGGALAIVPQSAMHTLQYQRQAFGDAVYGRYGFVNAFNPSNGWVNPDVIGIDTGITLLMASNRFGDQVWTPFMQHPAARRALSLAGFRAAAA